MSGEARDYDTAYALTSHAYRNSTGLKAMADVFEAIDSLDCQAVGRGVA